MINTERVFLFLLITICLLISLVVVSALVDPSLLISTVFASGDFFPGLEEVVFTSEEMEDILPLVQGGWEIYRDEGAFVYSNLTGSDPVHLPKQILAPGRYTWDVVGLDTQGSELARRGRQSFTIAANANQLPWIDPEKLLARVPDGHPRLLYPRARLPEIRATLSTTRKRSSWYVSFKAFISSATFSGERCRDCGPLTASWHQSQP